MTLTQLYTLLKTTNYPVAYNHFETEQTPPFITYLIPNTNNFGADNKAYCKINNVRIELYTTKKDLTAEQVLEGALDSADLFYDKTETYIDTEQLFQTIYETSI